MAANTRDGEQAGKKSIELTARIGLTISPDAKHRIKLAAQYHGKNPGEIVDEVIRRHVVGYKISYTPRGGDNGEATQTLPPQDNSVSETLSLNVGDEVEGETSTKRGRGGRREREAAAA